MQEGGEDDGATVVLGKSCGIVVHQHVRDGRDIEAVTEALLRPAHLGVRVTLEVELMHAIESHEVEGFGRLMEEAVAFNGIAEPGGGQVRPDHRTRPGRFRREIGGRILRRNASGHGSV